MMDDGNVRKAQCAVKWTKLDLQSLLFPFVKEF